MTKCRAVFATGCVLLCANIVQSGTTKNALINPPFCGGTTLA